MAIELRPVTDEEFPTYSRAVEAVFGDQPTAERVENWRHVFEADRSLAAFDGGEMVATAGAFTFELTLPGGTTVPAAGVTAVGVQPTHRRQGILRRMMQRQLDDVAARGEPVAILTASETGIYGRFGYGLASFSAVYELETDYGAFAVPLDGAGRLRMIDADTAAKVLPGVYERARHLTPGAVNRVPGYWNMFLSDKEWDRHGASALFHVVHESTAGEADGYACYRLKGSWDDSLPAGKVFLIDMAATSDEVALALWRYLLDIDLMKSVSTPAGRPVDEPLRHRLAEPRRLLTKQVSDMLWARILDVPAALSARRYGTEDQLVIELADAFRPGNDGRYLVSGSPEAAQCERSHDTPDLAMGAPELGAIYLGGVAPSTLARAGRITELTTGALRRADAFFSSSPLPYCATHF
jgi:predicted acetyltransferase